jgi:hydroxyacylglutathione hydrolase
MRLNQEVAIVGGGNLGFNLSAPLDCHVYLINGGGELALIDAGIGGPYGATEQILDNIRDEGYDPANVSTLILTHYHADHAGGSADFRDRLGISVIASPLAADTITAGDEDAISLPFAKRAGFYPEDYVFRQCEATGSLTEGNSFSIGTLAVTPYETPGHSAGHISLLVEGESVRYLISGDLVFFGGTILAQNIHDCSIQDYGRSVLKMAAVDFDAFLPGHLTISMSNGRRHVNLAAEQFNQLMIPKNAI